MRDVEQLAVDHQAQRAALARLAGDQAARQWSTVDPADVARTWLVQVPMLELLVAEAQRQAVATAPGYATATLTAQGISTSAEGLVTADGLVGVASDGLALDSLLTQPAFAAITALSVGAATERALAMGSAALQLIVRTQVADAGRVADGLQLAARRDVDGYVRVAVGATCSRCLVLAGKFYRWSAGFDRHPRCDCVHLPTHEAEAAGLAQNPRAIYDSLTSVERQRAGWSLADQRAIDDGADLNQVTNARRGVYTAGGRKLTREGTTRRGLFGGYEIDPDSGRLVKRAKGVHAPPRLMPEQIYRDAGDDRDAAIRLLRQYGYLRL